MMRAKDKLRAYWSRRENDLMLYHPLGMQTVTDAHYLSNMFNKEFTEQLKRRGYDLKTLKFSIEPLAGNDRFASQRDEGI